MGKAEISGNTLVTAESLRGAAKQHPTMEGGGKSKDNAECLLCMQGAKELEYQVPVDNVCSAQKGWCGVP